MSLVGSVPTPYIWDDRADFRDIAYQLEEVYNLKLYLPDRYAEICTDARNWVTSKESMMTADSMCSNVIDTVEETLAAWKPRPKHEFIKIEKLPKKKIVHKLTY